MKKEYMIRPLEYHPYVDKKYVKKCFKTPKGVEKLVNQLEEIYKSGAHKYYQFYIWR